MTASSRKTYTVVVKRPKKFVKNGIGKIKKIVAETKRVSLGIGQANAPNQRARWNAVIPRHFVRARDSPNAWQTGASTIRPTAWRPGPLCVPHRASLPCSLPPSARPMQLWPRPAWLLPAETSRSPIERPGRSGHPAPADGQQVLLDHHSLEALPHTGDQTPNLLRLPVEFFLDFIRPISPSSPAASASRGLPARSHPGHRPTHIERKLRPPRPLALQTAQAASESWHWQMPLEF